MKYQNITKEFEYIRADFSLTHKISDFVLIMHAPNNLVNSRLVVERNARSISAGCDNR